MPSIDLSLCTRCLLCEKDCPAKAITIRNGMISTSCIHCGHCVAICPVMAALPDEGPVIPLVRHEITPENYRSFVAGIRSCRKFENREIPDELLLELVAQAKHCPSASNTRPVGITIVRSPEMVKRLNDKTAGALLRMFNIITSPVFRPILALWAGREEVRKLIRYRDGFAARTHAREPFITHSAPAVVLFHAPEVKTGMADTDAVIWATYTSLYANVLGLGTCFNGFIVKAMGKRSRMNEQFGVPAGHRVFASLLVGYPAVRYRNECARKEPEIHFV